jgi:hypothetical protein
MDKLSSDVQAQSLQWRYGEVQNWLKYFVGRLV